MDEKNMFYLALLSIVAIVAIVVVVTLSGRGHSYGQGMMTFRAATPTASQPSENLAGNMRSKLCMSCIASYGSQGVAAVESHCDGVC